ncbi:MAG: hypothetical protein CMP11_07400 [Zetaproteobacteria bacterium]|nr:hypothetical protein [Pseudobdellovibrionaceae bacterium]|tara:strand:- start:164 stop:616 length:453 start_codon:yes stop_codon:yes gene_type:complete
MSHKKEKKSRKRYSYKYDFNKNLDKTIFIKKSLINGAGIGAFAKTHIPKGKKIGEYNGKILNQKEYENLDDKSYVFEVTKKVNGKYYLFYIDAQKGDLLRFVNGAINDNQKKIINVESYQYGEKIFFKATKNIKALQELIIDYGDNYWED